MRPFGKTRQKNPVEKLPYRRTVRDTEYHKPLQSVNTILLKNKEQSFPVSGLALPGAGLFDAGPQATP
jgi:hypothetical protein